MLPLAIELPAPNRPDRGLIASARPLDGEWWRGVTFRTDSCAIPVVRGPCPDRAGDEPSRPGQATFWSIEVRQPITCSTLSGSDVAEISERRLDVSREWSLARELQTGEFSELDAPPGASGNPALEDGVLLAPDLMDPADALGLAEDVGSDELYGARLFLHGSPRVATALLEAQVIWRDGRLWRTVLGNVFIASPGYTGEDLYVTSEVFAATANRTTQVDVDRERNDQTAWSGEAAIAVFDPCWHGRVTTNIQSVS